MVMEHPTTGCPGGHKTLLLRFDYGLSWGPLKADSWNLSKARWQRRHCTASPPQTRSVCVLSRLPTSAVVPAALKTPVAPPLSLRLPLGPLGSSSSQHSSKSF